jgi:acetylornithine deacetylase
MSMNTLQLLERLIAFPTVSRDSNLDLIEFAGDYLRARGAEVRLFASPDGRKANLYASLGPNDRPGVLLSGHSDVVPVDGQCWSSDPFRARVSQGRIYGRGAADMKGFLASALAAADRASRRQLRSPLHLAFSYDEEVGCVGVRSLIDDMSRWPQRPALCIVGEPTLMQVAIGHKGKTALKVICKGLAAHSALAPNGVNAIHLASDLVQRIRALQSQLAVAGAREAGYEIPYTTVHVGRISGGAALNIVPERCELELEIRNIAADVPQHLIDAIRTDAAAIVQGIGRPDTPADIAIEITNEYPGLSTSESSAVVDYVTALADGSQCIRVAFGSEAGLFTRIGVPTVLCGPGSITDAHRADEFVAEEQLARCDAMLERLINRLAS